MSSLLAQMDGYTFDWANQTNIHPVGLAIVSVLAAAAVFFPRKYAPITLVILACLIPVGQMVTVFTLDFSLLRILVLFIWLRILVRGELRGLKWHSMDLLVILSAAIPFVCYFILYGTTSAMFNRLGMAFDAIGLYFSCRVLVRTWDELKFLLYSMCALSIPICIFMFVEKSTGRNFFSVFGGVPEVTQVRQGKLRCQGAFSHPIMAGCYWAMVIPLFIGLLWDRRKILVCIGLAMSVTIVMLTASSTPMGGVLATMIGWAVYPARQVLGVFRLVLFPMLLLLHFGMQKGIAHLFARIDLTGSSTGYHRYRLIDAAMKNFGEWAVIGTKSTEHWGRGLQDITNQFILSGVRGGFLGMLVLVAIFVIGFRQVGQFNRNRLASPQHKKVAWGLGVSMFSTLAMFMAVSYFGQIQVIWYLLLAAIATLCSQVPVSEASRHRAPIQVQSDWKSAMIRSRKTAR
ncbi:MAG: hypothetical protein CMJ32_02020 [Phycisphaerae bacterium]|nr:hypothetical protein [Phycisphaerae bacterium]